MKLRMILILALALGTFGQAHAAADEAAGKWLEKLFGLVADNAIHTEFVVIIEVDAEGQLVEATARGELIQADEYHYVNSLQMEMFMPAMGETPMSMTSRQVADGDTMWAETHIASIGMTQIGKIALAELDELLAQQSGLEIGEAALYMDPMSHLESILEAFEVSVTEIADGTVSLSLRPTEATMATLEQEELPPDADLKGTLVLREEDAVPLSAQITLGPQATINMSFENFSILVRDDIPEDTFIYMPPPGAQVVDMAPLLRAGM